MSQSKHIASVDQEFRWRRLGYPKSKAPTRIVKFDELPKWLQDFFHEQAKEGRQVDQIKWREKVEVAQAFHSVEAL